MMLQRISCGMLTLTAAIIVAFTSSASLREDASEGTLPVNTLWQIYGGIPDTCCQTQTGMCDSNESECSDEAGMMACPQERQIEVFEGGRKACRAPKFGETCTEGMYYDCEKRYFCYWDNTANEGAGGCVKNPNPSSVESLPSSCNHSVGCP